MEVLMTHWPELRFPEFTKQYWNSGGCVQAVTSYLTLSQKRPSLLLYVIAISEDDFDRNAEECGLRPERVQGGIPGGIPIAWNGEILCLYVPAEPMKLGIDGWIVKSGGAITGLEYTGSVTLAAKMIMPADVRIL